MIVLPELLECADDCAAAVSASFSTATSSPGRGVLGLTSWTVSKVDDPLLGPRAGVLIPDGSCDSSASLSEVDCEADST